MKDKDKKLEDWIREIRDDPLPENLYYRLGLLFDQDPEPPRPSVHALIPPTHEGNTTRH